MLLKFFFFFVLQSLISTTFAADSSSGCSSSDEDTPIFSERPMSHGRVGYYSRPFMDDDGTQSHEMRRRYERLSTLIPGSHIPRGFSGNGDFDQTFSGIRVSRVGSVIRIGTREYSVLQPGSRRIHGGTAQPEILPEVVTACLNSEEQMSYYLPVVSFIDTKVNFLSSKRGGTSFSPIEATIANVNVQSFPGQMTIGSRVYAISQGMIVMEYANRNPQGIFVNAPIVPFIESTISRINSSRHANAQQTRDIARHEEQKERRREAAERAKERRREAAERAKERRIEQKRERVRKKREEISRRAEALGVSQSASYETKKAALKEHEGKERERSHAAFLQRRSKWSYGTSDNCSGYRIGSSSDPEAAKRILENIERTRKSGGRPSYKECLEARHAYDTLHPESRRAYDPAWD